MSFIVLLICYYFLQQYKSLEKIVEKLLTNNFCQF